MMKIKRRLSGNAGAPPTLGSGQLAWNSIDKTLYIGDGDNGSGTATSIVGIASGSFATQSYVDGKISSLVNGAGAALDTLSELANALGNDANFSTTISAQIAGKLSSSSVSSFMMTVLDDVDAATARNTLGAQASLGFTPVQQGGGTGQGTNKVYIGWANPNLTLQVDTTNYGATWPISINGNAATATTATSATSATNASQLASTTPSAFGLARLSDTNAASARTGLGLIISTVAEWLSKTASRVLTSDIVVGAAATVTLTYAATTVLDFNTFQNGKVTLTGNVILDVTNATPGQSGVIEFTQDATGSRTLTLTSGKFAYIGSAPSFTTTANAVDLLFYQVLSNGRVFISLNKNPTMP